MSIEKYKMNPVEILSTNVFMDQLLVMANGQHSHVVVMACMGLVYNLLCDEMTPAEAIEAMTAIVQGFTNGEIQMADTSRSQS